MRYLILGVTEARDEHGGLLPVGGARLRTLLAALALRAGRPATVDGLIDEVWAGDAPDDALGALQALVGRLRRALGRGTVVGVPGGYRLDAGPDDIDLYVFERLARRGAAELDSGDPGSAAHTLRSALALWRGPAFADLPGHARDHGPRAEAHRLAAVRQRIEADLRRGATVGLVPELRELTAAHPFHEPLHAQLLRALRAEGRQADALVAYEDARRALADGLGTDPGPELTALHRELLAPAGPHPEPQEPQVPQGPQGDPGLAYPGGTYPGSFSDVPEGNIRPRLTSFVGREPELRAIRSDLARARLVTLTGPGGSGKTRLAEESADGYGAWIVELAPLDDPSAVPGAVLSALGLRETTLLRDSARERIAPPSDPTERLVEHLSHRSRHRPFLLVLDNCEHVIDAAAALAETLLTHCPRLRVLATSREPLGVPGEAVRPVGPLPPDPAHRLFAERARAVRPDFDPAAEAAENPRAIAEICRRLDGLPLAIELAAARLRLLTPRQIADRLDDRFRWLSSGSRTVLPRQQTLRAVVDWSWDLLSEEERTVLRQVSVFAGGWDLAAAEAVTAGAESASLLGALVDKSLVVATPTGTGDMRYRLLETIHEYASERAAETPGLRAAAASAHTEYFTALAEKADPLLRTGGQLPWVGRLETELDNLRAALHRTAVTVPSEPSALRLVLGMGWFWCLRNYRTEGLAWADRAAGLGEDPQDPADPRYWPRMHLHMLRFFLAVESRPADTIHEDDAFQALIGRVAEVFGAGGPEAARFPGLLWPMTSYMRREYTPDVHAQFDAAVRNTRAHGGEWEYGVTLTYRTHMLVDTPQGMAGLDEDLAELRVLSRRVGDRYLRAQVASACAEAGMARGRYEESRAAYQEALELAREVGAHAELPFLVGRLAELSYQAGDLEAARKGLDEAEAEAERQHVLDAHAYVGFLRAAIALTAGEIPEARRFVDSVRSAQVYGSRPVQFEAAVAGLSARISVHEPSGGPAAGLHGMTEALRMAVAAGCPEAATAHLAEAAGITLPLLGLFAESARILAASQTWRVNGSRSAVEEAEVATVLEELHAALGPRLYERQLATGRALTPERVVDLLTRLTGQISDS
ncbi:BTAD domain-containing putative transcriptional regulator [Streptomyces sp. B1I3]|uniref:ATP-binding protein n=1 Tax=Streptomyces sp. B1I3 TaxID=3042264 RepID=UPI002789FD82|nr:BTAD domain-containing putative transcriptional regulator [Streptomyces sp. B1I3]MDQ0794966.1 putative ATPase/DNA-binding SARP family transcriptional activator [Streptomyces sp. B1I3]